MRKNGAELLDQASTDDYFRPRRGDVDGRARPRGENWRGRDHEAIMENPRTQPLHPVLFYRSREINLKIAKCFGYPYNEIQQLSG